MLIYITIHIIEIIETSKLKSSGLRKYCRFNIWHLNLLIILYMITLIVINAGIFRA